MPLPTTHKLFIDVKAGLAYPTFSSTSPISNPSFYLGDLAKLQLFFIEQTGLGTYPRQEVAGLGSPGIRVAVGAIDASPTSGHFNLTFGAYTTPALDYNITAAFLETRLNQLNSISSAGGVTVSKIGDNYAIKFVTNGSRAAFTADAADLVPLSTVGLTVLQEGDSTHQEIVLLHLQQNVAALATSFSALSASTATVSPLSAWDGSRAVYRLTISPDPKGGTFSLAFDAVTGTDVSTASIAVGSTALDVQNALNINALEGKVTVQQVGAYAYDIAVTAQPDTGGLTANGSGLLSFAGFEGDLDLNTANAVSYLDGADSIETTLEVEISDGTANQTVLQIPCTIRSSVIDETSVNPVTLDPVLTQATGDGRYLRQDNNLGDLPSVPDARDNLDVYSKAETDAAIAAGGGGGGGGGVPEAPIDGVEYVRKDGAWSANSGIPEAPIDGTSYSRKDGAWSASPTFDGGTVNSPISVTGSGGTVTLSDTGLDLSGSTGGGQVKVGTSGIVFPDSTTMNTAPTSGLSYKQTIAQAISATYAGSFYWAGGFYATGFYFPSSGQIYNDWVSSGKFKVKVGGYLFSFSYLSSGAQYLNNTDDTSTVSLTGSGETLYLNYDGEDAPYPFLIT